MGEDMSVNAVKTKELPISFGPLKDANGNARITGPCGRYHGVLGPV